MRTTIKFRPGYAHNPTSNPVAIKRELDTIEKQYGTIPTDAVVRKARSIQSAMHKEFVWDDKKAATEQRKNRARNLVRAIHLVTSDGSSSYSVFTHIPLRKGVRGTGGYTSVTKLKSDEYRMVQAIGHLRRHLNGSLKALRDLENVAVRKNNPQKLAILGVIKAGESFTKAIDKLAKKLA